MAVSSPVAPTIDTSKVKKQVEDLAQKLQERGAKDGARRLKVVAKHIQYLTIEGAFQYLRRDEIVEELENQPHELLSFLRFWRNVLSIAPIVLTWLALGLAAIAYQSDLADTRHYPDDLFQPFLQLWQEGFHGNHGFVITFSSAAFSDFGLLTLLVTLIVFIPIFEWLHRKELYIFLENCDAVIDDLLAAIAQDGANAHLADSDIQKISKAIEQTLQKVLLNYDRVAGEAREFVKNTNQSTQSLVKNFEDNLIVFNSDVKLLTNDLQKLDNNLDSYGQKLTELTDASSKLVGSSNDLARNAKSMADSANQSSQASQGISSQLSALNIAQQEIVKTQQQVTNTIAQTQQQVASTITQSQQQMANTIAQTQGDVVKQFAATQQNVVQEIESAQKNVVKEITSVADHMEDSTKNTRDVAKELENVVQGLKNMTQADFQSMTNQVGNAATQVDRVAASLSQVDQQMLATTKALSDVATSFKQATTPKAWWQFWKP